MTQSHSEIRQEIEETREALAAKASELSNRASSVTDSLRISHHIEQRPFTMVALSIATGFAVEKLFFGRRKEPSVYVLHEEGRRRSKKIPISASQEDFDGEEDDFDGIDDIDDQEEHRVRRSRRTASAFNPMKAVAMFGQLAAGALAREVATRLMDRPPNFAKRKVEDIPEHETIRGASPPEAGPIYR